MVFGRTLHLLLTLFVVGLPPALLADECTSSSSSSIRLSAGRYRNSTGHWRTEASLSRRSSRNDSDVEIEEKPWHYDVDINRQRCSDDEIMTVTFNVADDTTTECTVAPLPPASPACSPPPSSSLQQDHLATLQACTAAVSPLLSLHLRQRPTTPAITTSDTAISASATAGVTTPAPSPSTSTAAVTTPAPRPSTSTSAPAPTPCVGGDYSSVPNVGFYKLYTEKVNWEDARRVCEREGAHLAIVNSKAEEEALVRLMKRSSQRIDQASIGFHDKYTEGEHFTVFGHPLMSTGYVNWAVGEPNNLYYDGLDGEDCGVILLSGALNDNSCKRKAPFICEKPLQFCF